MTQIHRMPRVVAAVLAGAFVICGIATPGGQGAPPGPPVPQLKLLVSGDGLGPSLPDTFGVPYHDAMNDQGDRVFAAGYWALFLARADDPAPTRLLQMNDEVPGIPHSRVDQFTGATINQPGVVFFHLEYFERENTQGALFTYDAAGFHRVALSNDPAPDCGGAVLGRNFGGSLNDAGDVLVTAPLTPLGALPSAPARNTLFLKPAGGGPLERLVGPGDGVPGMNVTLDQISGASFNNNGHVLFRAAIVGGSGGFGLFQWSREAGVQKIMATGDADLRGGTFDASMETSGTRFNNAGQVAFYNRNALYIGSTAGLTLALAPGAAMPAPLGTRTLQAINGIGAFNDAGQVALTVTVSGIGGSQNAVLRHTAGGATEVIAYRGQPAPGTFGITLAGFRTALMNAGGDVSFFGTLSPTSPAVGGFFLKRSGAVLAAVVLHGQPAPAAPGGTYSMLVSDSLSGYSHILADSLYFESTLLGGTADYAAFVAPLSDPTQIRTRMTTSDKLPAGSAVVLRDNFFMGGNGTYTGVMARRAGSDQKGMWVHNVVTGTTTRVVVDGDAAPAPLGGRMTFSNSMNQLVNANGEVVFPATVTGYAGTFLFHWSAADGVSKIVGPGDLEATTGLAFSSCSLPSLLVPPLTEDRVVFRCTLAGGASGLFVGWRGSPPAKIAMTGEPSPIGGTWSAFGRYYLNRSGQVAFQGTTTAGATGGLFVGSAGSAPVTFVALGDAAPGGGTFSAFPGPSPAAFTDRGQVVFFATVNGGTGGGLFVAAAGDPGPVVTAVALNGGSAPLAGAGNWAFDDQSNDACANALGDILFQAPLAGGTAGSGLFLRRASTGAIETVAVQGQAAPGLPGIFPTVTPTLNDYPGEFKALGPTGEAVFQNPVDFGDHIGWSVFLYRGPGRLERLISRTDPVPESGGGTVGLVAQGLGAGATGLFFFRVVVIDGTLGDGIYMVDTFPPTLTAASDAPVLWPPNGKLRTVAISGVASDVGSGLSPAGGTFEVTDEYGEIQPRGTFAVGATGSYSFAVALEANRLGTDRDGRHYTIRVTVEDRAGNATSTSAVIVVPLVRGR